MVDQLDLKKSFVDSVQNYPKSNFKPQPRQKRWRKEGDNPITQVEDLPHDWNAREPDLDPKYVIVTGTIIAPRIFLTYPVILMPRY